MAARSPGGGLPRTSSFVQMDLASVLADMGQVGAVDAAADRTPDRQLVVPDGFDSTSLVGHP